MNFNHFAKVLLKWYPKNKRELPWRNTKEPYKIWLSEIILQQTKVVQGMPYYLEFAEKFPTVFDLATASTEEIMRLWQGLGYYSRARNLHTCAKDIVKNRGGAFPENYKNLLALKGVGKYTAAAIASFAYQEKVAVVDGNVFRVLSRYFGIDKDIHSTSGKKYFEHIANQAISEDFPGEYNQAIMEFGALQCVPKNPDCTICPLHKNCFSYQKNLVNEFPVNLKKIKVTNRHFLYFMIQCDGKVVTKVRGPKDIWQGLTDFPQEEVASLEDMDWERSETLRQIMPFKPQLVSDPQPAIYKHILTHQRIFAQFIELKIPENKIGNIYEWTVKNNFSMLSMDALENAGKPKLIVNYLKERK